MEEVVLMVFVDVGLYIAEQICSVIRPTPIAADLLGRGGFRACSMAAMEAMEAILALGLPGPRAEAASDDSEEERLQGTAALTSAARAGNESQGLAEEVVPVADGRVEDASSSNNANYECAF